VRSLEGLYLVDELARLQDPFLLIYCYSNCCFPLIRTTWLIFPACLINSSLICGTLRSICSIYRILAVWLMPIPIVLKGLYCNLWSLLLSPQTSFELAFVFPRLLTTILLDYLLLAYWQEEFIRFPLPAFSPCGWLHGASKF